MVNDSDLFTFTPYEVSKNGECIRWKNSKTIDKENILKVWQPFLNSEPKIDIYVLELINGDTYTIDGIDALRLAFDGLGD